MNNNDIVGISSDTTFLAVLRNGKRMAIPLVGYEGCPPDCIPVRSGIPYDLIHGWIAGGHLPALDGHDGRSASLKNFIKELCSKMPGLRVFRIEAPLSGEAVTTLLVDSHSSVHRIVFGGDGEWTPLHKIEYPGMEEVPSWSVDNDKNDEEEENEGF